MKFHLSALPLGWAWIVPGFHLPEVDGKASSDPTTHMLSFSRKQIDFPLGPGQAVHTVLLRLKQVLDTESSTLAPLLSEREERRKGLDDSRGEEVREDGE